MLDSDYIKIEKIIADTYGQFSADEMIAIRDVTELIELKKNEIFVEQ